jgi:outer membrane protein OmpA-like peptidoglycan-associated protein
MRKSLLKIGVLAAAASALLVPTTALADGPALTLRVEPGVAFPLTQPQTDRYKVGGDLVLKPTLGLTPWLDASLVGSALVLPAKASNTDAGLALGVGAGLRIKRPHDESNTGRGWTAVSPWLDGDVQYVRTGPLDRAALSLGAGASVPTSDARTLWVGPFVRYMDIVDSLNPRVGIDNSDAHVLIVGVSFEFGAAAKKKAEPAPPPQVAPPPAKPQQAAPPPPKKDPPQATTTVVHVKEKVQFPYDSAVPLPVSQEALNRIKDAAKKALADLPNGKIEVGGHASSEGQVAHNDKLSLRRAQAVVDFLIKAGIPADRLQAKGYGSRVPVADNATAAGRVANRRVEFSVDLTITQEAGAGK